MDVKTQPSRRRGITPPPGRKANPAGTSLSLSDGICILHDPARKKKKCRIAGCCNQGVVGSSSGLLCTRHHQQGGAKVKKKCSATGCNSSVSARNGGRMCRMHGAKEKRCYVEGCTNFKLWGGLCKRHGAIVPRYSCKLFPGRKRQTQNNNGGRTSFSIPGRVVCKRNHHSYPPQRKDCSFEGCTMKSVREGMCIRHEAKMIASIAVAAATAPSSSGGNKKKKEPEWDNSESEEDEHEQQPVPEPPSKKSKWESGIVTTTTRGGNKKEPEWDDSESEDEKITSKSEKSEREAGNTTFGSEEEEEHFSKKHKTLHSGVDSAVGSAKRSRVGDRSDDDDDNDNMTFKNHRNTQRPSREVLGWIRTMSSIDQRKHVNDGMRVKVRFKDNVWYGGMIASVLSLGHKIKISFDDGTVEVSDFPDRDIVVDDQDNGRHRVDAQNFIPVREALLSSNNDSEKDENEGKKEGESPANHRANPDSSDSNDSFDTDEEEELGALIYRSSLTARETTTTNNRQP